MLLDAATHQTPHVSFFRRRMERLSVLGPLDLICSKLARADDLDLDDVEWLVRALALDPGEVLAAARSARVPDVLHGAWSAALPRLEARLAGRR